MKQFTKNNFKALCRQVAVRDPDLQEILNTLGYPPYWTRPASFATLVLIILEQQVSLAAAFAAYTRLREKLGTITPEAVLALTDEELRQCYFTRQKTGYVRGLATAIQTGQLDLAKLHTAPDDSVRLTLTQLKGIGQWTVDIYLLHSLQRADIFPIGDLALVNAVKAIKGLPKETSKEALLELSERWKPYRSIATLLFWHWYIQKRGIKVALM